jgi:ribosomal protein S18 acetylase RimI-like enzyme
LPDHNVVRPLVVHDWDALVVGKPHFDADGLIVAERDGRVVGFAHAGFGPVQPEGPSHRLDTSMGTIALLALEPGLDDESLERGLILEAERYLGRRGASVVYAGGRHPLDPFYWGLYGGSEFSGILSGHTAFHRAVQRSGYQAVSTAILLELNLNQSEPRDPRMAALRRQTRFEAIEDNPPMGWWTAAAIGPFHPTYYRLVHRGDQKVLASAMTWEIASELGNGGPNRTALILVQVNPEWRRKGLGRLLSIEVLRHCREMLGDIVCVQTLDTNEAALSLYEGLGFQRVDSALLYRLPAELTHRGHGEATQE